MRQDVICGRDKEILELVRAYYKISDPQVRKRLFEMTKALGAAASSSD